MADRIPACQESLVSVLARTLVGQPAALRCIAPYVEMAQAGLAPSGRPIGVFLLLGPTGTGKTRTVEVLAGVLHGSEKCFVRIDCGEYQMDHETAKLIGAPPGYLGHAETQPVLTEQSLLSATSPGCDLAIILFDEIEKASPALTRLLLGVLDRAKLRLGDNTEVDFEKTLIFLTSNLGAQEMMTEIGPRFGFRSGAPREAGDLAHKLEAVALGAVRRRFAPEFVNRIDAVIAYQPLDAQALGAILDQQIADLQRHVNTRLGARCFELEVDPGARRFFLERGTSVEYGARELKRVIHRNLTQRLATMVARGEIEACSRVLVQASGHDGDVVLLRPLGRMEVSPAGARVLIVDENGELALFLKTWMTNAGWEVNTAGSGEEAREAFERDEPNVLLVDSMLSDEDGLGFALEARAASPGAVVLLITEQAADEHLGSLCKREEIVVLQKPFLASFVMGLIRDRLLPSLVVAASAAD